MTDGRPWFVAAAMVLLLIYCSVRVYRTAARQRYDFTTYYLSSTDARTGIDPYRDRDLQSPYIYPPLLFWLVTPFTHLDEQSAAVVWTWATFAAWVLAVHLARSSLDRLGPAPPPGEAFLTVWLPSLLAFRAVFREIHQGQVNLIVLAIVTFGFWCLSRRKDALAGLAVAVAADIKILPAAFGLPLAAWGRWRALGATAVLAPVVLALPVLTYGAHRYGEILGGFLRGRLFQHASDLAMDTHMANQSLIATASRWLTEVSPLPPGYPVMKMNVASLPLTWVATGTGAIAVALLVACGLALYRSRLDSRLTGLGVSLVWLTTHLASKKTWEEHLVTLVFVYTSLLHGDREWRRLAWPTVAVAALLQWSHTPVLVGSEMADRIQALGPTTLSLIILWVHVFLRLWRSGPLSRTGPDR